MGAIVKYIELFSGCGLEALFEGTPVFRTEATDIVALAVRQAPYDESHRELGYLFIFPALKLRLWRPTIPESKNDPDGRFFTTIGIGAFGLSAGTKHD